jgi:hypothetical protein
MMMTTMRGSNNSGSNSYEDEEVARLVDTEGSNSNNNNNNSSPWNLVRSVWRLQIVGLLCMVAAIFWLQAYHFQFGMPVQKNEKNRVKPQQHSPQDSSPQGVVSGGTGDDDMDDDDDDSLSNKNPSSATPCPFVSPRVTGPKNWTLYPKQVYTGLELLRPRDSILQTAFPGCVPFVLPKQKLLLFTVLKVSSTVFTQVAKRLDGNPSWSNDCGHVQNPLTTNLTYLTDIPPPYAQDLLLDPDWTKAIFVRDPKERVLSAYLNKAVAEMEYTKIRCCRQAVAGEPLHALLACQDPDRLPQISFAAFLQVVVPQCRDGHWCLQSDLLRPVQWEQVNFVGHFDRLAEDSRTLLERVGAWDAYGATGWPNGGLYAGSSTVHHQTGAHDRMREYYTPALEVVADAWYQKDYESPYLGLDTYTLFEP